MAQDASPAAPTTIASPFAGLGEEDRRVLSYAAAIGMEFDFSVLITAIGMEEEPLAESLERLVHLGIIKELNWGDSYSFLRVVTLAQTYSDISSSRVRVIHKRIAEAYEKLHPDPSPDIIPEMGRQFHLGGVHDKSLLYNRYAARLAVGAFSPDTALRYLERAREDLAALHGDHRLEQAEVLKEIGEQYGAQGDGQRAEEFYGESIAILPEGEVTMRALLLLSRGNAASQREDLELARRYCDEAIRLLEKVGHKKGLARAHSILAQAALKEGRYDIGLKEVEATLGFLDPEKDPNDVARCYVDFGNAFSGNPGVAEQARSIEYYRKAILMLEQLHDYKELARAHNSLAVSIMTSNPKDASEELKIARKYSESCKDWRLVGWALFNSVEIHLSLGEDEEATRNNKEAHRILSKINDKEGLQQVALNEGILAQRRKAYGDSEKAYIDSLKRAEGLGYSTNLVEVLVHMGMMYDEWGRRDDAVKQVSRIMVIGEDKINVPLRPAYEDLKKQLGL
jgi:tetratricopeptide (TPR) repeat protein